MRRVLLISLLLSAVPALPREPVDASSPTKIAVTVYRDPNRAPDQKLDREWPRGFAMISETRTVVLPRGESTIRFEGVAEGMVAVTAIVTGLPGGTIEKNRNADLLSPGALVDGSLGNRVTITRTNPATGREVSEDAIVRTRADGGLVLQTGAGFEAVRCSGLPENVTFDRIPAGLSAQPVYSIDTVSAEGGTYSLTLTYLAWGFDWQANYVATLAEGLSDGKLSMHLASWLTLVNDNGQSFPGAELMAVAGKLRVESNFQSLADPPTGKPLSLTCYPLGSTAEGTPEWAIPRDAPPPAPPPPVAMAPMAEAITVTGARASRAAMVARQEDLADLKLYRVPEPVTLAAKSQKQVAFLDRDGVTGRLLYTGACMPWTEVESSSPQPAGMLLATVNDERHGLGVALPTGGLTVFDTTGDAERLVANPTLRDYASGQDVELSLGTSSQVQVSCRSANGPPTDAPGERRVLGATLTNANPRPVTVRLHLAAAGDGRIEGLKSVRVNDGAQVVEISVPANGARSFDWIWIRN